MAEIADNSIVKRHAVKRNLKEEEKPWRNYKRESAFNVFLTVEIPSEGYNDLALFLNSAKNNIYGIIVEELGVRGALKFYLTLRPQLLRIDPDGFERSSTPYLCSLPTIVLESSNIREQIDESCERIIELLSSHEGEGSGFTFDCILQCLVNIATYDVVGEFNAYSTAEIYPKQESYGEYRE